MKKTAFVALLLCLALASCGVMYLEGPDTNRYEIGDVMTQPDQARLRELGEQMQQMMVEFNFKVEMEGRINVLDQAQRDYNVNAARDTGTPEIKKVLGIYPGQVFVNYTKGSLGKLDLIKDRFAQFKLSGTYSPPMPTPYDMDNNRELTFAIVERVGKAFFKRLGIEADNFEAATPRSMAPPVTLFFFEDIADKSIQSPNRLKVVIDFWGMVVEFERDDGPAPKIATRPDISMEQAKEIARKNIGMNEGQKFVNDPLLAVRRTRAIESGKLFFDDSLVWFFDISKEPLEKGFVSLSIDAHSGKVYLNK